jgi:hypothetical protein
MNGYGVDSDVAVRLAGLDCEPLIVPREIGVEQRVPLFHLQDRSLGPVGDANAGQTATPVHERMLIVSEKVDDGAIAAQFSTERIVEWAHH